MPMKMQSKQSAALPKPSAPKTAKAYVLPAGYSGCAFWRLRLPLSKLQKIGSSVEFLMSDNPNKRVGMADIQKFGDACDVMVLQAPGNTDSLMLIKLYKALGKKVVVEYDDYSFDLSPGNPRYNELGTKECELKDKDGNIIFSWKDGVNGFNLKENIAKYEAFVGCLQHADLVTTTTEYLADKFRKHAKNVAVCPNSLDFDLWRPIPRPKAYEGQVRIGWFGGDSHYEDIQVFKPLLAKLANKYPQVKIVFQCPPVPQWEPIFKDIPPEQVDWCGWSDLKHYTLFLAARHWDIGLVPLEDNEFNKCKSNIKWLEFAAMKVPVIAQNMVPYSNSIKNGKTGFLADKADEWYEHACRLIENPELRKEVGQAAYNAAFKDYNLEKNCRLWEKAYLDCLEGKNGNSKARCASKRNCSGCGVRP